MTNSFQFSINRQKLRQARLREGRHLLRSNLTETAPATLWTFYIQLTDGRQLTLTRSTEPEKDDHLLLRQMHLALPCQSPPKISSPS